MSDQDIFCTKCGEKINPKRAVWLELDQRYGKYAPEGAVPALYSQGGFPFGRDCAIRARHWWDLKRLRNQVKA